MRIIGNLMKYFVWDLITGVCVSINITSQISSSDCEETAVSLIAIHHRALALKDRRTEIQFHHLSDIKQSQHVICWETSE